MLRNFVKHVGDGAPGCHSVDRDLLITGVFGETTHKRVNGALGPRVKRVPRNSKVFGGIGRHENDTAAVIEVAVRFPGDKKLTACVEGNDTVKFFLQRGTKKSICEYHQEVAPDFRRPVTGVA